jgi:LysM repeat protein
MDREEDAMRVYLWGFIVVVLMSAIGRVGAQDVVPTVPVVPPQVMTQSLRDVVVQYNICPKDVLAANRSLFPAETAQYIENTTPRNVAHAELPIDLVIPPHEPCYYVVQASWKDLPKLETEYNICIEDFYDKGPTIRGSGDQETTWYLWREAPPCVNNQGQRLKYFDANLRTWDSAAYSELPFIIATSDVMELGICLDDLVAANPYIRFNENIYYGLPYMEGMRLFVPNEVTHCHVIPYQEGQSLYGISQQTNVCIEAIIEASDLKRRRLSNPPLFIPDDQPPCYDTEGHRIGMKDREVYFTQSTDSFLDIALKYEVCLNDLWDANPVMVDWYVSAYTVPTRSLPPQIFIPDTPPCAEPMVYRLPVSQNLFEISTLTNVCWNRLAYANPKVELVVGAKLIIPQRPHCFHLPSGLMQAHMCYPISITAETDLTGHEPPLSWSLDTDLPYCYQLTDGMTVFYENKPYTLYTSYGSVLATLQCFNVDDVYVVRMRFGQIYLWSEYGKRLYDTDWLMIPQPHADCPLLHMDREARGKWASEHYQRGELYNGIYRVQTNDTLSSIGREFGYLPVWIAQANNLSEPYTIYFAQELKMPNFPSLYILLGIGQVVGIFCMIGGAIYGLRSLLRRRSQGKKKNEAA